MPKPPKTTSGQFSERTRKLFLILSGSPLMVITAGGFPGGENALSSFKLPKRR